MFIGMLVKSTGEEEADDKNMVIEVEEEESKEYVDDKEDTDEIDL